MSGRLAKQPFRFSSCMELREVLGKRAMDEHRLLELIEEAPADSIYYHTHSYYLRHAYTQQLYPNDFATWIVSYAQDRVLGERLAVLDPFEFSDIEQLRDEIMSIMADHLNHSTAVARCIVSEPFEFIRSHVIEIPLGLEVRTLWEFRDALADVEVGAVYNHVCEARMRKKPLSVDFAYWLSSEGGLGLQELALKVEQVGRLGLSLEGMRNKILRLCDQELARQGTP
jgi:hypothetical protein